MQGLIAVVLGGGVGAYLRHSITCYTKNNFKVTCKNTFLINIIGCLLFGIILGLVNKLPDVFNSNVKLFLTTGLIASFTTFGTFAYENVLLLKDNEHIKSLMYTTLSLVLGMFIMFCGVMFINKIL